MKVLQEIDENSQVPKYKQVVKLVLSDIESGIYKSGDRIPSINETSEEYLIARDTVEKAYKELLQKNVIVSVKGKGYFVTREVNTSGLRICLVFNKLSTYKKAVYDSFVKTLDTRATVDLHVYNFNLKVFERIITSNLDNYDYFVIVPHFLPGSKSPADIIKLIPSDKVLIIDKKINELLDKYPIVYQDFETDIFDALNMGHAQLSKYKQLNLLFPDDQFYSREIRTGFIYFCQSKGIPYRVFDVLTCADLEPGNAYVIINDDDLVTFIKYARERGFQLGKAVGVISYNENPMKEILEDGITTISTNHEVLGEEAAKMILSREVSKVKIPFRFIARNSL